MNIKQKRKNALSRVDVQVFLLTVCMVVLSSVVSVLIIYHATYQDTLLSLRERVNSLYSYLERAAVPQSFEIINTKTDMDKKCYRDMKDLFYRLKLATGVQYLYTAKRADNGTLVYVIDGLDLAAEDFRYPGDPIEEEITAALSRALDGEKVLPKDIKRTPWGDIFIAYMPMYGEGGKVIGAIGIEFEATHQYSTYAQLRVVVPVVIVIACLLSGVVALIMFRRLSNPHFQDLANTDWLTGLKNRNAYELDARNMVGQNAAKGMGLLLADLNGLKLVNDTEGHEAGDEYIRTMADSLRDARGRNEVLYRIGGDEFLVLIPNATNNIIEKFIERLRNSFDKHGRSLVPDASFAIGWAICKGNEYETFETAYRIADNSMYENKKEYYENKDGADRRRS